MTGQETKAPILAIHRSEVAKLAGRWEDYAIAAGQRAADDTLPASVRGAWEECAALCRDIVRDLYALPREDVAPMQESIR